MAPRLPHPDDPHPHSGGMVPGFGPMLDRACTLTVGLQAIRRAKNIADVVDLFRVVQRKRDFALKLPMHLRAAFEKLVEWAHGKRHPTLPAAKFWKKYA